MPRAKEKPVLLTNTILRGMRTPADGTKRTRKWDDPAKGQKGLIAEKLHSGKIMFRVYYRHHGRPMTYTLGEWPDVTIEQARKRAQKRRGEAAEGDVNLAAQKRSRKLAAEQERVSKRKDKHKILSVYVDEIYSPDTELKKSGSATLDRLEACFKKEFYNLPMDEITQSRVERWRTKRQKEGIASATINRDVTTLRAVLSHAVRHGVISVHPLQHMKQLQTPDDKRVRWLGKNDKGEEKRLRAVLDKRTDHMRPLVLLAMNTGMRRGELFNLTWEDVNFQMKQVTVRAASSKTATTRHIPLNPEALAVLQELHTDDASGLVFRSGWSGGKLTTVKTAWRKILADAKIDDFRFHDLRHHFASMLVMDEVELYTVQRLLGHSNPIMTQRYAHLTPDHMQSAVDRLVS